MTSPRRRRFISRFARSRPARFVALAAAALPICQATGCFPDPIGAINFQLQLLVSGVFVDAINTIVQNLLHL